MNKLSRVKQMAGAGLAVGAIGATVATGFIGSDQEQTLSQSQFQTAQYNNQHGYLNLPSSFAGAQNYIEDRGVENKDELVNKFWKFRADTFNRLIAEHEASGDTSQPQENLWDLANELAMQQLSAIIDAGQPFGQNLGQYFGVHGDEIER